MSGSRGGVCPGFSNGSFDNSVDTTPAGTGLDSRRSAPEAPQSAKRQGHGPGRPKSENRFWRFRGSRGYARPRQSGNDVSQLFQWFVCPFGSHVAACGRSRLSEVGAGSTEEREEARACIAGPAGGSNLKNAFGALEDPVVTRAPLTCQAVGKWCVPASAIVGLFTRFTRCCLWPLSALGGRCRQCSMDWWRHNESQNAFLPARRIVAYQTPCDSGPVLPSLFACW